MAASVRRGEDRQHERQQTQTVTHDTQHINNAARVFAIVIQTKINKNDSPVQGKGG